MVIATDVIPMEPDTAGVVRVGGTRVTLDTIIAAFKDGATAEEIVHQYPSLALADVYSVIGHYLRRTERSKRICSSEKYRRMRSVSRTRCVDLHSVQDRLLARLARTEA